MIPARTHGSGSPLRRFDGESQWAIKRFLVKLTAIGVYAVAIIQRPAVESILILAYVNVLCSMLFAVLRREPCNGSTLNHWDEAAIFTALCALAHTVRAAIG